MLYLLLILIGACLINAFIDAKLNINKGKRPNHTLNAQVYSGIAVLLGIVYVITNAHPIWDILWIVLMAWSLRKVVFDISLNRLRTPSLPWDYDSPEDASVVDKVQSDLHLSTRMVYAIATASFTIFLVVVLL